MESDLFGHERGAFTAPVASGWAVLNWRIKPAGTDEGAICRLEPAQAAARFAEQEFERLGSNKLIQTDVRLSAATNRDLKNVGDLFPQRFYYRLNVFLICLPRCASSGRYSAARKPLPRRLPAGWGRNIDSIPAETLRTLSAMEWPGNVRELENVAERAVLKALICGNVLQLSLPEVTPLKRP